MCYYVKSQFCVMPSQISPFTTWTSSKFWSSKVDFLVIWKGSKILCLSDIERDQVPFICKTLGCRPVASPDHFTPDVLAHVENVDELPIGTGNNCLKVIYS